MESINIRHIDLAHASWLGSLDFYGKQLDHLKGRLMEISGRSPSQEVARELEQFRNKFTDQRENIARLAHSIRNIAADIIIEAQMAHTQYINGELGEHYQQLSDEYTMEEKVVNELRHDFSRFSAAWI